MNDRFDIGFDSEDLEWYLECHKKTISEFIGWANKKKNKKYSASKL